MQQNAARGLQYLDQGYIANGATEQIVDEAVGLAHGNISDDKVIRMNDWFKNHISEMNSAASNNPESPNFPSAEAVTFLLWGGDPLKPDQSMKWAEKQAELLKEEMTNGIQTVTN